MASASISGNVSSFLSRYEPWGSGRVGIAGFADQINSQLPSSFPTSIGSIGTSLTSVGNGTTAWLPGAINVQIFGADPTGQTDSTAAIRAAHSTGFLVYYPHGTYLIAGSGIIIPSGGIVGDGEGETILVVSDISSNDIFEYTGQVSGRFENFRMYCSTNNKAGGYFISVTSGGVNEVEGMRFHQIMFQGLNEAVNSYPNGIHLVRASKCSIHACEFINYTGNAILVENQNNSDSGDSVVSDCYIQSFQSQTGPSTGIMQYSSGGLRIVGTKFNGGGFGYQMQLNGTTSNLQISACSFENIGYGIYLAQAAAGTIFDTVVINGNEFAVGNTAIWAAYPVAFLVNGLIIADNKIQANLGVQIDYVNNWIIQGNVFQNVYGIIIGSTNLSVDHNTNGKIVDNQYNVSIASIALNQTGSPGSLNGPTEIVKADYQSGTGSITTNTSSQGLFFGTASIVFPKSYNSNVAQSNSDIITTLTSSTSGLTIGVTAISATGATIFAYSNVNGGSVPFSWSSQGQY